MQPAEKDEFHWPSLILLLFFLLCILILFMGMGLMILVAITGNSLNPGEALQPVQYSMLISGMLAGVVILGIPSFYCLARLAGWESASLPMQIRGTKITNLLLISMWMTSLVVGHVVLQTGIGWLVMPFVNVMAAGLPILVLARIALSGIEIGSRLRGWGMFGMGLALGPLFISMAEILIFILALALGFVYAGLNPEVAKSVLEFSTQMQNFTDPNTALEAIQPILAHPATIFSVLAIVAVLVPLTEEALKPIGVWLMAERLQTPADGFAMGILSGAGYALFENLGAANNTEAWAFLLIARVGTSLLHVLTGGLIGWALVAAWREKAFLRLGATYALAVFIHGLWNGLTVLASGAILMATGASDPLSLTTRGTLLYSGLAVLTVIMLRILVKSNRRLRPVPVEEVPEILESPEIAV